MTRATAKALWFVGGKTYDRIKANADKPRRVYIEGPWRAVVANPLYVARGTIVGPSITKGQLRRAAEAIARACGR